MNWRQLVRAYCIEIALVGLVVSIAALFIFDWLCG